MRPSMECVKKIYGMKELIGAEIGVAGGVNAYDILNNLNIKKMYLIDPYIFWKKPERFYDINNLAQAEVEIVLKNMKDLIEPKFKDKIVIIREMSNNAIINIKEELDFVYIDGNHIYKFVLEDIKNYYPKVKVGGIIGGHDFHLPEVRTAVLEFCNQIKVNVKKDYTNQEDDKNVMDWWFIKK